MFSASDRAFWRTVTKAEFKKLIDLFEDDPSMLKLIFEHYYTFPPRKQRSADTSSSEDIKGETTQTFEHNPKPSDCVTKSKVPGPLSSPLCKPQVLGLQGSRLRPASLCLSSGFSSAGLHRHRPAFISAQASPQPASASAQASATPASTTTLVQPALPSALPPSLQD